MDFDPNKVAVSRPAAGEIQAMKHLTPEEIRSAGQMARSMDIRNSLAITGFGVKPQREMSALADPILRMVATKDSGVAGEVLTELLQEIKALDAGSLPNYVERGLSRLPIVGRMFNKFQQFISRHEKISAKIERTTVALEKSKSQLSRDIAVLDKMYDRNSLYFREMLTHIAAGEMKLENAREEQAVLADRSRASGDPVEIQLASDMTNAIARLERRVHDLKLSAMISLQSAPQIRLVQNSNQALVEKLQSSVLTTIPLWKSQVVIAIALFNQNKGLVLQRNVSEATNKMLKENMERLGQGAREAARESERGIVEVETLRTVNRQLIDTIEDTLRIHEDGRAKRQQAEAELEQLQEELKTKLAEVRTNR
jgi:uncharacterized protein YaaN involved in tellurite resistance